MPDKSQHELALELAALANQADKVRGEFESRLLVRAVGLPNGVFVSVTAEQLSSSAVMQQVDGPSVAVRAGTAGIRIR